MREILSLFFHSPFKVEIKKVRSIASAPNRTIFLVQ